jgi:4-hydroxy-tetrahydrodipicolinate synthase
MEEGLADGVVSGIACALPELITAIYLSKGIMIGDLRRLLDESIEAMASFPTPWGLKVASAIRGFTTESYPFPLSADRKNEIAALRAWFIGRLTQLVVRRAGSV